MLQIVFLNLVLDKACKDLQKFMRDHEPTVGIGHCHNNNKWKSKKGNCQKKTLKMTIEQLVNNKTIYPTLVVPIGNDGSTGHAISVVDDFIFDSTQENVLILSRESLDWICGRKGCKELYVAMRFINQIRKELANSLER